MRVYVVVVVHVITHEAFDVRVRGVHEQEYSNRKETLQPHDTRVHVFGRQLKVVLHVTSDVVHVARVVDTCRVVRFGVDGEVELMFESPHRLLCRVDRTT